MNTTSKSIYDTTSYSYHNWPAATFTSFFYSYLL